MAPKYLARGGKRPPCDDLSLGSPGLEVWYFLGTKLSDAEEALRVCHRRPNLIPKPPRTNVQPLQRYKAAQIAIGRSRLRPLHRAQAVACRIPHQSSLARLVAV